MGLSDETSLVCKGCGVFNFKNGFIIDGDIYCKICGEQQKNRMEEGSE